MVQLSLIEGAVRDEPWEAKDVHVLIQSLVQVTQRSHAPVVVGMEGAKELLRLAMAEPLHLQLPTQLCGFALQTESGTAEDPTELADLGVLGGEAGAYFLLLEAVDLVRHDEEGGGRGGGGATAGARGCGGTKQKEEDG